MQEAKEDVARWPDHDSSVPVPDHEISRLRLRNVLKSCDPSVKIVRTRVGIWEAGTFINRMHQVRAVVFRKPWRFGIQSGCNDGQSLVHTQRAVALSRAGAGLSSFCCFRRYGPRTADGACSILSLSGANEHRAQQDGHSNTAEAPHHPILMRISCAAEITIVQRPIFRLIAA